MEGYSEFGLRARQVMLQKRITGAELAKKLGISAPYISELLRGTRDNGEKRKQIADYLGIEYELSPDQVGA